MENLGNMIGTRVDSRLSAELKEFICKNPRVLGAHDLSLHQYGPERFIGFVHIELPDDMTAKEIHGLTCQITNDVFAAFGIILTVGIYASNTEGAIFAEMKRTLSNLIEEYPEILQMHGFYADTDKMTVYFDLIIDFRAENFKAENKEQIEDEVVRRMKERFTDYEFVAVLDSDVSD